MLDEEYERLIDWALVHRRTVAWSVGGLLLGSLLLAPLVGAELMPESDEGEVRIGVELPSGTRMEVTDAVAREMEAMIESEVPETSHILTESGRRRLAPISDPPRRHTRAARRQEPETPFQPAGRCRAPTQAHGSPGDASLHSTRRRTLCLALRPKQ